MEGPAPRRRRFALNVGGAAPIMGERPFVPEGQSFMKACNFRSTAVTVLMLCTGVAIMASSALTIEVKASRGLRLGVVDSRSPVAVREALHRVFAAGLGAAVSQRCGGTVEVRVKPMKPAEAKSNLGTGDCDAVLVLGDDRPFALRRLDAVTLGAMLDPEAGQRPVYLIVGNGDPALRELLTLAFSNVLSDRRFLKSLENAGENPVLDSARAKLASAAL